MYYVICIMINLSLMGLILVKKVRPQQRDKHELKLFHAEEIYKKTKKKVRYSIYFETNHNNM